MQPAAHVDAGRAEAIEFSHQRRGVDDHARADHGVLSRTQDAAGNQLQDKAITIENDGMARVVAAGATRDVVKGSRHVIDDFAFAFIAPLRAHHDNRFHSRSIPFRALAVIQAALCRDVFPALLRGESSTWLPAKSASSLAPRSSSCW